MREGEGAEIADGVIQAERRAMKKKIIGIASQEAIRARARAIARGEREPAADEPKVWFTSMHSLADACESGDGQEDRGLARLVRQRAGERRIKVTLDEL
jgi:predicted transcriptional regulator